LPVTIAPLIAGSHFQTAGKTIESGVFVSRLRLANALDQTKPLHLAVPHILRSKHVSLQAQDENGIDLFPVTPQFRCSLSRLLGIGKEAALARKAQLSAATRNFSR
jgi:hypothetical protein